jgi:hypothetical protein
MIFVAVSKLFSNLPFLTSIEMSPFSLAISKITQLCELLVNPAAIHKARALLAEQIGKFTLNRVEEMETGALKLRE